MRIEKMTADFGALENSTLELRPGLNVVLAPNESGKSTWCAFIRAMLYGIKTSEHTAAGRLPDKVRYVPWSGRPMKGVMSFSHAGREYEMTRLTKRGVLSDAETVLAGTAEKVPELSGKTPGEALTGASEDVFRRSAFIAGTSMEVSGSGELEKKISGLVSTGEEGCSFEEADERLTRARKLLKNARGGGLIPDTEKRAASLRDSLEELEQASGGETKLREERSGLEKAALRMESYIAAREKWDKKQGALRYAAAAEMARTKREALNEASSALTWDGRNVTEAACALERDAAETRKSAETEADRAAAALAETPEPRLNRKTALLPGIAAAVVGAAIAVAGAVMKNIVLAAVGAAILVIGAVLLAVKIRKNAEIQKSFQAALQAAETALIAAKANLEAAVAAEKERLAALGLPVEQAEELLARAVSAEKECAASERAEAELRYLRDDEAARAELSAPTEPVATREMLERTRSRIQELARDEARLTGERAHLGDPAVLATELGSQLERLDGLNAREAAISMAKDALNEAQWELRSRFSPLVGDRAAELFSRMTGGRYSAVTFDRNMSFRTRLAAEAEQRESNYLSGGAADQMYLSVRLAICLLALGGEEPCPLVLDDALASFDDRRAAEAMGLLKDIAKERQVLLFTCRQRDAELAASTEE